jgi:arginase family enzyme
MPDIVPAVLKLDGLSRVPAEMIPHREPVILNPGLKLRMGEKIFKTYEAEVTKDKVRDLARKTGIPETPLILNTRGTYHHLTYGFLDSIDKEDIGYIHVDNHSDTYMGQGSAAGYVGSGTFVPDIYEDLDVSELLFVGSSFEPSNSVPHSDLTSSNWRESILENVKDMPENIYLSVDLDVFPHVYIECPFNQGVLTYRQFHFLVSVIREHKTLVGADLCGLDRPYEAKDREFYGLVARTIMEDIDKSVISEIEEEAQKRAGNMQPDILKERNKQLLDQD